MKLIDAEYTKHPFYGARRLQRFLKKKGYLVGRKHVGTLMRKMGIEAVYPKPNLSWRHPEHKISSMERGHNIYSHDGRFCVSCGNNGLA